MPCSRPSALAPMCNRIFEKNPSSILDIGVGFGKIGFLAREYTDVRLGRYFDWKTRIDGIEIYEKYITKLQREIYNNIYIGDAIHILPTLSHYDMIICSDMLEHLTYDDGVSLLDLIKDKSKFAMIATPVRVLQQGELYGNIHEKHISSWPKETLSKWGQVLQLDNAYLLEISPTVQAKYGDTVKVHYSCKLRDGTVFATTNNRDPVQVTIGQRKVVPGFENALVGMVPGESITAEVPANNAYGPHRKEMTQQIPRDQFPKHLEPEVGQLLQDRQKDGRIINITVTDVSESSVMLDANHPLAGKDLVYDIRLVDVL